MSTNLLPLAGDIAIALIAVIGGFGGYWFGKRKRKAEIQSLNVAASEATVGILLKGLRVLEKEMKALNDDLEVLTELNENLKNRNEELVRQISGYALDDLRGRPNGETGDFRSPYAGGP